MFSNSGNVEELTKKETQLKLENEHKFMQTIINGLTDPVKVVNSDYSVNIMNKAVKKTLVGRTFIDSNSPKCYEISHHRDTPCEPCPLEDILNTGKAAKVIHNHKHVDGSDYYVELVASPLFDDSDNCAGIIESSRDITEHIKLTNELQNQVKLTEHRATHDYLTGLPNRALFMDRLEQAIRDTKRHQTDLALFFIDLDYFKEVNDTFGHHIGDKVLQEVCKKFKLKIRENDVLSRLGGDEFTIILKDFKNTEDISVIANKFIKIFEKPIIVDGNELQLSASIGISVYHGGYESGDKLLQHADAAMYRAKENGKNSFEFFEDYIYAHSEINRSNKYL